MRGPLEEMGMTRSQIRRKYDFHDRFDVFVAADMDVPATGYEISLYESVTRAVRDLDMTVMSTHEGDWISRFMLVKRAIIPESEIVFAYCGKESTSAGSMAQAAYMKGIPVISFHEPDKFSDVIEMDYVLSSLPRTMERPIVFTDAADLQEQARFQIRLLYSSAPALRVPRVPWGY